MDSDINFLSWNTVLNVLLDSKIEVKIPTTFKAQVREIRKLLNSDNSGMVSTIYDFMINSATVDYKFETGNDTLDKLLSSWQTTVNHNIGIDIPKGLKSVSEQYFRERWDSSFVGLRVRWVQKDGWMLPQNIWMVDGQQIGVDGDPKILGGLSYYLGDKKHPLHNSTNEKVYIRKPYNHLYDLYPSPYFVHKGTLYYALLKQAILQKQADVIQALLPYLFNITAGNDEMLKKNQMPKKEDIDQLKNQIKTVAEEYDERIKTKGLIGGFRYDVKMEHMIPDLTKFFNDSIVKPIDRNILSSMGLIELKGFSSNREEAILNPKMLVEEVTDAVIDLGLLYEEVIFDTVMLNEKAHPGLMKKTISVIPGTIKAFITDNIKILARSAYDRGLIDKKTFVEDFLNLNFEVIVTRREIEKRRGLEKTLFPYVIMNQDANSIPDTEDEITDPTKEQKPEKKKTEQDVQANSNELYVICNKCTQDFDYNVVPEKTMGSIECPHCHSELTQDDITFKEETSEVTYEEAPYNNIDELPENIKSVLPIPAQLLWMKTFNSIFDDTHDENQARKIAWYQIKKKYKKNKENKKWMKK